MEHSPDRSLNAATGNTNLPTATSAAIVDDVCSQFPDLVRSHVNEIIRCNLPRDLTKAYIEAMARDPRFTQRETDPLQFVRYCNYDLWEGAQRLCLYWMERTQLFGPHRAFLPLALTGTGALTPEDVETLHAGFPALLPDCTTTNGLKCVLVDRRKWIPSATTENKLRALFYIARLLAEDDRTQLDGPLVFVMAVTPRDHNVDWAFARQANRILSKIFPFRPKIHVIAIPMQKRDTLTASMVNAIHIFLQHFFQSDVHFHFEKQPNQILNELQSLGLARQGIPLFLGGEWRTEDWFSWCQERAKWEREVYKDHLLKESVPEQGNPTADRKPAPKREEGEDTTNAERVAKRKRAHVLYSRRKRERRRIEFQHLQEEANQLTRENDVLQVERTKLEALLSQAEVVVASLLAH